MFEKILSLFLKSELKIRNIEKLKEYITFCIDNNTKKCKSKTANHHILPKSINLPFIKYKNLKENNWNCSTLTHKNHYIAHWMLYDAIEHYSITHSFIAMHNKDLKLSRINDDYIANSDIYDEAMRERSKQHSIWCNEISIYDNSLTNAQYHARKSHEVKKTRIYDGLLFDEWSSKRMLGTNNIIFKDGIVNKILETKANRFIGEYNMHQIGAIRAAQTMKKTIFLETGEKTTIYKETSKKIKNTLNKEVILDDGTITTIAKIRGVAHRKKLSEKGKKYILKSIFKPNVNYILFASDIRKISPALEKLTVENYLGKSKFGKTTLSNKGKENLIGLYCIPSEESAELIDDIDEFIKSL